MLIMGYAAYFNNVDGVGDIIDPKAFDKTLVKFRKDKFNIPVLREHSRTDIIGSSKTLTPDGKGLFCVLKIFDHFIPKIEECKDNKIKLGLSIGYRAVKYEDSAIPCQPRLLTEIDLLEISVTVCPANEKCIVRY